MFGIHIRTCAGCLLEALFVQEREVALGEFLIEEAYWANDSEPLILRQFEE